MDRAAEIDFAKDSMSEPLLRSILATVPDATVLISDHGIITSFSAAAEKMFGYREADVRGENVSMLMPSPDRERHDGYLGHYRRTGERKIIGIGRVTVARRRDGTTFPIELAIGEMADGERRIFIGFIHDITDRQHKDARLQELQSELAHIGRLSEMSSLASSLAHELNQPLTAIASYCEAGRDLLAAAPASPQQDAVREALDEAAREALRAGQILRRLRDFIRGGKTERRVESLSRLVTEANALALVGTREHDIDVQLHLNSAADEVFVDRIQIQQVITNLIRNAIDAMLGSQLRFLTIRTDSNEDGLITVTVEDSGSGIDAEHAAMVFRPFVSTKDEGMGVGLSICRTIVEAHGGQIWFENRPDGGTIFRFTIPSRAQVK